MSIADFTEEEFNHQIAIIYRSVLAGGSVTPSDNPKVYILGGQPGAGKSKLHDRYFDFLDGNLVVINGDEYRKYHPRKAAIDSYYGKESSIYTNLFSNRAATFLRSLLSDEKYNISIEGTLRTASVPLQTAEEFKAKDYFVTLGIVAVKPLLSYLGTILRAEIMIESGNTPRFVPQAIHDAVVASIADNLEQLYFSGKFDNIEIIGRDGILLYSMDETPTQNPKSLFTQIVFGEWTTAEKETLQCTFEQIIVLMDARGASKSEQEQIAKFLYTQPPVSALNN
jgi:UDP-N-acetylglucosamine kinase